jgi:hypothetical protein
MVKDLSKKFIQINIKDPLISDLAQLEVTKTAWRKYTIKETAPLITRQEKLKVLLGI